MRRRKNKVAPVLDCLERKICLTDGPTPVDPILIPPGVTGPITTDPAYSEPSPLDPTIVGWKPPYTAPDPNIGTSMLGSLFDAGIKITIDVIFTDPITGKPVSSLF